MYLRLEPHHARLLWNAGGWRQRAACRGMGSALFFPAGERDAEAVVQIAGAKEVCAGCGVRLHCLTYALVANPDDGIWGGLSPSERRALRRARRLRYQKRSRRIEGEPAATARVAEHAARCNAR